MSEVEVVPVVIGTVEIHTEGSVVQVVPVTVGTVEVHTGPPGPQGAPGESIAREVSFPVPSATWVIPLSGWVRRPVVSLYTVDGEEFEADVFASTSLVSVSFPTPTAGSAVIS